MFFQGIKKLFLNVGVKGDLFCKCEIALIVFVWFCPLIFALCPLPSVLCQYVSNFLKCLYLQYFDESNSPLWDCIYCGHEMNTKEDQRIHVQQHCKERPPWDDFCPFCGLEFPTKHSLAIHMGRWCKERQIES